jgi:hypothetical protein
VFREVPLAPYRHEVALRLAEVALAGGLAAAQEVPPALDLNRWLLVPGLAAARHAAMDLEVDHVVPWALGGIC